MKKFLYFFTRIFATIALSVFLFCGCPGIVKEHNIDIASALSITTYGNYAFWKMEMSGCTQYQYNVCSALCPNCLCGPHAEVLFMPRFGGTGVVSEKACPAPGYIPMGGMFQVGATCLGACNSPYMTNWSTMCNIWCKMQ